MNIKKGKREEWLLIFHSLCLLHSTTNSSKGSFDCEDAANAIYERLCEKIEK